jgi:mannose-1-phosphate guanylyltransferase
MTAMKAIQIEAFGNPEEVVRSRHRWAVVLAGGDGTRLRSLTLKIAGDSRPTQFCSIFGGESLLTQIRARLETIFHVDRQLFVVTRAHETYYREELRNVDDSRIIPQPLNRGTGNEAGARKSL